MQSGAMRSAVAVAEVRGGKEYPKIRGTVKFYSLENATLVIADIKGLPKTRTDSLPSTFTKAQAAAARILPKPRDTTIRI